MKVKECFREVRIEKWKICRDIMNNEGDERIRREKRKIEVNMVKVLDKLFGVNRSIENRIIDIYLGIFLYKFYML